jgi:hydrogenase nickel incorporation protein HypB
MCVSCGCGNDAKARVEGEHDQHEHVLADGTRVRHTHGAHAGHEHDHDHEGHHHHSHDHSHEHRHEHTHAAHRREVPTELVELETALLDKNQRIAERNRGWFAGRGVVALNLMSSPGAGKTSLLVRTLQSLGQEIAMAVIEGDQETSADAERIRATGAAAIQINTGAGCHLEADMIERAVRQLAPAPGSVLFIENVGNLVCPALFDLGESARIVILSVTEGEDKPLKYPHMFRSAQLMVTTKIDLAPHVDFDIGLAEANARRINPGIRCLRVSSRSGEGLSEWHDWLRALTLQQQPEMTP